MTPAPFDFRKPPPGDLERRVEGWLAVSCRRAATSWSKLLSYPAEWKPGPVESVPSELALRALHEDALGVMLSPPTAAEGAILLTIRRPLLLALLGGLFGEAPAELPKDRDTTEIERPLIGYLLDELFVSPLQRGWPAVDPLVLTAGPPGSPITAWHGARTDMVLVGAPVVSGPFGDHPVHLIMTKTGRWERLARMEDAAPGAAPEKARMEALVKEMKVDLDVLLGTAELTMSEVSRLSAGDVVVLRQKVTDPLDGLVAGSPKLRVWPGAVGTRAAVQVCTSIDGPHES